METSCRQLFALLAVYCSLAPLAALGDTMAPQDYRIPADIAGDACRITDPTDPHQILGPNPAHADCLTALYPSALPAGLSAELADDQQWAAGPVPGSASGTVTLWLAVMTLAMLVLAGFNSRKRHRQLPMPGLDSTGTFTAPPETRHGRSEGSRWHEE
ncbi:MAG TPA: hypothetical protein VF210_08530 [Pseudomonadales bacterium]